VPVSGATVWSPPGQGLAGTAGFAHRIGDGTSTATAIVTITGDADEDPPIGGADAVTTLEEIALAIGPATLLANDADPEGQPLTVTAVSAPIAGTVVLTSGLVVFTPTRDATGAGGFTYTLSDGTLTTTATVVVTILPVNDAPIAVADALATELPTRLPTVVPAAALLGNDTDVDGDTLSITAVTAGTNCAVTLGASGVTITPTARGPLSFTYVMSDGHGATDTAQVTAVGGNTRCGNGTLDTVETCDDGANEDSDGCSADCYVETCGDGIVNANLVMPQVVTLNIAAEDVDSMTLRINGHDEPLATAPTGACDELTYVITTPAVLAAIVAGTNDIEIAHTGLISDVKMRIDTVQGPQFFHPRESLVPGCDTAEAADPVKTTFAFQSGVVTEQCDAGAQNANQPNAPCRTNCVAPRCGDRLCDTATENPAWCSDCTLYGDGQCDEDGTCEVHESTRSCPADCTDCDNDGTCEYGEGIACGDCPAFACFEDGVCNTADGEDYRCTDCPAVCDDDGACEFPEPSSCGDCAEPCNNDTICGPFETPATCPGDCTTCDDNFYCEPFEDIATCGDCSAALCNNNGACEPTELDSCNDCYGLCGDNKCGPREPASCPQDCTTVCGDGTCSPPEDANTCPMDCAGAGCGDGMCMPPEDANTCPMDCAGGGCGDGMCMPPEDAMMCPMDCAGGGCGDGMCTPDEALGGCPMDCPGGGGSCGDGECTPDEAVGGCPMDCPL